MKLKLFWKSKDNETFELGILEHNEDTYIFKIFKEQLREAIRNGCYGIGNFELDKEIYYDTKLFSFFENRLPEDNKLKKMMEQNNMTKLDKMEILKITKAKCHKDRYWVEEVEN